MTKYTKCCCWFLCVLALLSTVACQPVDQQQSYSIIFPTGWKTGKISIDGASAEQAISGDGSTIVVAENKKAYDYSKSYNNISSEMAEYIADNLFGPLASSVCPNARLGDQPNVASLNNGKSVQSIYVCGDDIMWFTVVFGSRKAYMILVTANKHNKQTANIVQNSVKSFKISN